MKKFIPILLIFSVILISTGCNLMIAQRVFFGVRKAKPKSKHEIIRFLEKNSFNISTHGLTTNAYNYQIAKSSSYFSTWELWNKDGYKVEPTNEAIKSCSGTQELFITTLKNDSSHYIDSTKNIFKDTILIVGLSNLDGKTSKIKKKIEADFLLVIYWSTFMGKYSKQVLELENSIKNNKNINAEIIKVNMDYRNYMKNEGLDINIKQKVNK